MTARDYSIVKYYAEHERYRCGYCKSIDTNYSHGMWAHNMTVEDYQDLIDRGWRRSGRYCYKPTMSVTCCPTYTIKCMALDLKLSKSQKKILKRFHRFLACGDVKSVDGSIGEGSETSEGPRDVAEMMEIPELHKKYLQAEKNASIAKVTCVDPSIISQEGSAKEYSNNSSNLSGSNKTAKKKTVQKDNEDKCIQQGVGMDTSRPPCKKAKLIRLEHKKEKLVSQGFTKDEAEKIIQDKKKPPPVAKTVEDFLNESLPENPAHNLQLSIVRVDSSDFMKTLTASHDLYTKYQTSVHKETREECNFRTFCEFLVDSPLQPCNPADGPPQGYGSFHQQYWLDGRLIAVGVIDILPKCVSSVYFYYDPELNYLTLGTYASLQELSLTRSLQARAPALKNYYMGFYIHSCQKMRYKAAYSPSYLLCPETYTWHPIDECKPKLDINRYTRFEENMSVTDSDGEVNLNQVLVLYHNRAMPYHIYCSRKRDLEENDSEETIQYAQLVGMKCARRMLLVKG